MKHCIWALIGILFFSCTSNTIYEKPKDLIPKDTMAALMTDLYIASSSRNLKNKNFQKGINYVTLVYNKYKIDSTRFKKSNFYYTTKVDDYQKLLEQVKINLESRKKVFTGQRRIKDSIRQDSIKRLAFPRKKGVDSTLTYKKGKVTGDLLKNKKN